MYQLNPPYLLFAGCIEPRKNVPNFVLAYQRLAKSMLKDVQLVLAGPFSWASEAIRKTLAASGENIRYLGYVPEADLPWFAARWRLLYRSCNEDFGLPAAQARRVSR